MHVGMAAIFQNPGRARADREVYRSDLRLADLAEPLGFQSIWGVEHHFTDYTMCPDDKIMDIRQRVGNDHYVGVFSYAGMPPDEAERNMRLFAAEVMPALAKVGDDAPALRKTA